MPDEPLGRARTRGARRGRTPRVFVPTHQRSDRDAERVPEVPEVPMADRRAAVARRRLPSHRPAPHNDVPRQRQRSSRATPADPRASPRDSQPGWSAVSGCGSNSGDTSLRPSCGEARRTSNTGAPAVAEMVDANRTRTIRSRHGETRLAHSGDTATWPGALPRGADILGTSYSS